MSLASLEQRVWKGWGRGLKWCSAGNEDQVSARLTARERGCGDMRSEDLGQI